jgi:hypothetical protein
LKPDNQGGHHESDTDISTLSDPQTVMPRSLVWLFAIASGLSVANVYYAQPLLDALARDFAIGDAAIGGVIAATRLAAQWRCYCRCRWATG